MTNEPSKFWQNLAKEHRTDLDQFGLPLMKRHQALRYFTWRWNWSAAARSAQLRFLLRRTTPRDWLAAWRNPELSDDAWASTEWSRLERRLYTFSVRLLWMYAERHGIGQALTLREPDLGGPLPVYWGGRLISQDLANTSLELRCMQPALARGPRSILEVGAGYGRTAYALLSLFPSATYTIVDIEPAVDISRWYLTELFGAERLRFLGPDEAASIPDASIDLAISISSLHEMTPPTVSTYLHLIDQVAADGHVYLKQWTSWHNVDDLMTSTMADYPFPDRWRQLHWAPAPVQTEFTEGLWAVPH